MVGFTAEIYRSHAALPPAAPSVSRSFLRSRRLRCRFPATLNVSAIDNETFIVVFEVFEVVAVMELLLPVVT